MTVRQDPGQSGHFSEPTAIVFALDLNGERHGGNVPSGQLSNKPLQPTSDAARFGLVAGAMRVRRRILSGVPFETTRWSLVVAAGSDDASAARTALAALCQAYWYPLYAYVRRRGADADDARDLT